MNEVPRYGVHSPRYFKLLLSVREAAPAEEWIKEAVEEVKETEQTFAQRIRMRLNGYIYIGHRIRPGWRAPLPFYLFKCPVHGMVQNYPMGYAEILRCPLCDEEAKR